MVVQHKQVEGAENAGPLSPSEVTDTADTTMRAPKPDTSGRRLRAIPYANGTTIKVSRADFKHNGINHGDVEFDFRVNNFTLPVNPKKGQKGISKEAADFLASEHPQQFEYMNG